MANRNVARAVRLALIAAGAASAGFQAPVVIAQDAELEQIVVTLCRGAVDDRQRPGVKSVRGLVAGRAR